MNAKLPTVDASTVPASARRKAYANIVLPLFLTSIIAYLDRVNLSYAALTMNQDLGFPVDHGFLGLRLLDAHRVKIGFRLV